MSIKQIFLFQSNVSKKAGAFDLVICTGVFFNDEPEGEGIESSDIILWNNLKSGKVRKSIEVFWGEWEFQNT